MRGSYKLRVIMLSFTKVHYVDLYMQCTLIIPLTDRVYDSITIILLEHYDSITV